ncbi:MAG: AraC family transcriptional regulator [Chitinophagaceae bacterium]
MKQHKVYIKGMVCDRCVSTVKSELENMGLQVTDVGLGEVSFSVTGDIPDTELIDEKLKPLGFSVLMDKRLKLVKNIKALVEEVYSGDFDFPSEFRFSELASEKLQKDYNTIRSVFTSLENTTIEKFIIDFRIEKVKEFLVYTPQTLADISFRLGFSSVAHLSRQFKTVTGFNPSHLRAIRMDKQRISDKLPRK